MKYSSILLVSALFVLSGYVRSVAQETATATLPDGTKVFAASDVDQQPTMISQEPPAYPFEMRRAGITGQAVVEFIVNDQGDVINAHSISSTRPEFEKSAVRAVSRWKYKAGIKNGQPVNTRMQLPITYSLGSH